MSELNWWNLMNEVTEWKGINECRGPKGNACTGSTYSNICFHTEYEFL